MNAYESKQLSRKERYERLAEKCAAAATSAGNRARQMGSVIPFGQPILVGHHSEGRDRRYRGRVSSLYERSFELQKKAAYFKSKAASVGSGGISSDDPEAVTKLKEELVELERKQETMKRANLIVRAFYKAGLRHDSPPASEGPVFERYFGKMAEIAIPTGPARKLLEPDFCGRRGFADYQLTNNSANIRRIKARIKQLSANAGRVTTEREVKGVRVVEDAEDNRVQLFFPGKPSEAVRSQLKSSGFRWSPDRGAWVRQLNNAAVYAANYVLQQIPEQGKGAA